jgi:hypothetical protein
MKVKGNVRYFVEEPYPRCPRCCDAEDDGTFSSEYSHLERDEIECSHCGQVYAIRAHVTTVYDCYPKGEERCVS